MAKKKNSKKSVKSTPIIENALPQNILPIGERVEEDKNIYISQPVYKEIHKFTQNKTTNESGGIGSIFTGNWVVEMILIIAIIVSLSTLLFSISGSKFTGTNLLQSRGKYET